MAFMAHLDDVSSIYWTESCETHKDNQIEPGVLRRICGGLAQALALWDKKDCASWLAVVPLTPKTSQGPGGRRALHQKSVKDLFTSLVREAAQGDMATHFQFIRTLQMDQEVTRAHCAAHRAKKILEHCEKVYASYKQDKKKAAKAKAKAKASAKVAKAVAKVKVARVRVTKATVAVKVAKAKAKARARAKAKAAAIKAKATAIKAEATTVKAKAKPPTKTRVQSEQQAAMAM